jgi:hypothetical protein
VYGEQSIQNEIYSKRKVYAIFKVGLNEAEEHKQLNIHVKDGNCNKCISQLHCKIVHLIYQSLSTEMFIIEFLNFVFP